MLRTVIPFQEAFRRCSGHEWFRLAINGAPKSMAKHIDSLEQTCSAVANHHYPNWMLCCLVQHKNGLEREYL